jgi:hypothetical protein
MTAATVTWAPGQGVVQFPGDSGVLLLPTQKLVVQMHYNLADADVRGQRDQTTLEFAMADIVPNIGTMLAEDELLASLNDEQPITLQPGEAVVTETWSKSFADMVGADAPPMKVWGFMPHMHELGSTYRLTVRSGGTEACGVSVDNWDFNWQRMYFLKDPFEVTPESEIEVECTYDTRSKTSPVLPGWGTRNEMCTGIMYVTVPLLQ